MKPIAETPTSFGDVRTLIDELDIKNEFTSFKSVFDLSAADRSVLMALLDGVARDRGDDTKSDETRNNQSKKALSAMLDGHYWTPHRFEVTTGGSNDISARVSGRGDREQQGHSTIIQSGGSQWRSIRA